MKTIRGNKYITIIRLVAFAVPTTLLLLYEYFRMGKIGNLTADGKLYLIHSLVPGVRGTAGASAGAAPSQSAEVYGTNDHGLSGSSFWMLMPDAC